MERILKRLINESERGIPIIVEGFNDELSLRQLGVKGEIIRLKTLRGRLINFIDELKPKREAIILTDFNGEGEKLARLLTAELSHIKVKANDSIRRQLRALARQDVKMIEDLAEYRERLKSKAER
jgi:2,5-diamino-6-(ribosylamino)-4(3H)-pyrimidinone 5'-phosphate reductase